MYIFTVSFPCELRKKVKLSGVLCRDRGKNKMSSSVKKMGEVLGGTCMYARLVVGCQGSPNE